MTNKTISTEAFDILFKSARSYNGWLDKDVPDSLLKDLHDIVKYGPTSANSCPMRVVFIRSMKAKTRLDQYMDEGNKKKTMEAPVTAILAYDLKFYDYMAQLFPAKPESREWFSGDPEFAREAAFRNATLQAGYFIIAARGLGLDCGPMSGFDEEGVRKEFFEGTDIVPNFLCNLGYGDPESVFPRLPRFEFEEVCTIL